MRRLFVVLVGLALAITAASLFVLLAALAVPAGREILGWAVVSGLAAGVATVDGSDPLALMTVGAFMALASAVILLPPVIVAAVGEVGRTGSYVWYGGGAGVLTAAIAWLGRPRGTAGPDDGTAVLLLLFLTGGVSGLVYWAVAGRGAARTG